MKGGYLMNIQNFVTLLNKGLREDLISADDAIRLIWSEMPHTLQKGDWAYPRYGGVMVLRKRLVVWNKKHDGTIILDDLSFFLKGN